MDTLCKFKTRQSWDESGHAHELTFSCRGRRPLLVSEQRRYWLVDSLELCRQKWSIELWAYVIMPEHVHALVFVPSGTVRVANLLKTIKQSVSRRVMVDLRNSDDAHSQKPETQRVIHIDRFWEPGGGYDRNLWREDAVWTSIRYIHENPVKRGLCRTASDWIWSSA